MIDMLVRLKHDIFLNVYCTDPLYILSLILIAIFGPSIYVTDHFRRGSFLYDPKPFLTLTLLDRSISKS